MPTTSEPDLDSLLEAFQLGDPFLSREFDIVGRPIIWMWARRHGWGLPRDVVEEIVQEVFLAVSNPTTVRFDRRAGTATKYLLGRLLNAVKTVQTDYGLRRLGSDFTAEGQREFKPVEDADLVSPNVIPFEAINARHLVKKMLVGVEAVVIEACHRVWVEEEPLSVVAVELGMSRFALARKLAAVRALSVQFAACA